MPSTRSSSSSSSSSVQTFPQIISDTRPVSWWRQLNIWFFHFLRLGGCGYFMIAGLIFYPLYTILFWSFYYLILSKNSHWISLIQTWAKYCFDPRFHLVKVCDIKTDRPFLISAHAHGILGEGAFYSLAVNRSEFLSLFPGLNYVTTAAKEVKYFPLFREIFSGKAWSSAKKSHMVRVLKEGVRDSDKLAGKPVAPGPGGHTGSSPISLGVMPGGFSEAVFSSPDSKYEYAYLKGRQGFVRLAIECKVDILPIYEFNLTKLYWTPAWKRGVRARWAQKLRFPLVIWFGSLWTNVPRSGVQVYTVLGEPFPASKYSLDQVNEAHEHYCQHLKALYDKYRHQFGEERELKFIGKDFNDDEEQTKHKSKQH